MKKVLAIVVVAAAVMASCNNSGTETSASVKSVDSAMQAAPDSIKAPPLDSAVIRGGGATDTLK